MALTSPGVEVTIIDQSQYLPAPGGSVPLVIIATAQNKADASGTAVAAATTAANAGKLFQITSQRDLVNLYGSPFFYTSTNGTPIQGYELNEYGLLAAYSTLGATNRCYVLRADIDLASLVGQTGRPVGFPANDTYWLDSTTSEWGIYEFNQTTGKFVLQAPIVISDAANLTAGFPLTSIGNIGDYAVSLVETNSYASDASTSEYFYKTSLNEWVAVGTTSWRRNFPTIQFTNSVTTASIPSGTFKIQVGSVAGVNTTPDITVVLGVTTISDIASVINALGWTTLTAAVVDNKLRIFSTQLPPSSGGLTLVSGTGSTAIFEALGQPKNSAGVAIATFYQPSHAYGTAAQMPLWTESQTTPRPTGSVWIKVGAAGNGLAPVVASFNSLSNTWVNKNVTVASSDYAVNATLDATGGQSIIAGSVYAQYTEIFPAAPVKLWKRIATGPTVVTGTNSTITFPVSASQLYVTTSTPGSSSVSVARVVSVTGSSTATQFVTAWTAANIAYTTATVTIDGSIQLTHTTGGVINLNDFNVVTGISSGVISALGFMPTVAAGCKYGTSVVTNYSFVPQSTTTGAGTTATFNIQSAYQLYLPIGSGVSNVGTDYIIGDEITILGSSLGGTIVTNDLVVKVTNATAITSPGVGGNIISVMYVSGNPAAKYVSQLSNWVAFDYIVNEGSPTVAPLNDTNWFFSVVDQADIMVQKNGAWIGYGLTAYDNTGAPAATGTNATDPNGPIISASIPTLQSDGTALVYGDLWIDTSDLEVYPVLSRWELVDSVSKWVLIDNTDQVSSTGVVFADARWATSGTVSPTDDPVATIPVLLDNSYVDLDAPTATLYPQGMLLFNTRRSGYTVKQYKVDYFNSTDFPGSVLPTQRDAWVTVSGNQANGAPYMGRKAQRAMVVQAMNAVVATNTAIRDEDNAFNLIAAPNYPELQPAMVTLNNDRGQTGYIIGDTPMRLKDDATDIQAWATNAAGAASTGEDGCVTRDTYLGLFYPSGITNDLSGNLVAVPSSHMMLRTFIRNDNIAYPWLAAAGTRRGNIDNATNIGYLDGQTGEFQVIKTRLGIRDVLYLNFINPMVFFTGVGLLNYGNKTSFNSSSALDRTNVARLVAYIRRQLTLAARPFIFEPNDAVTRQQIAGVVQSLMVDLVAKRGLYDYLVVCDDSNNTPARIDRNELWIDVAIEPVKAAEFIYIPVRILNTGELSGK